MSKKYSNFLTGDDKIIFNVYADKKGTKLFKDLMSDAGRKFLTDEHNKFLALRFEGAERLLENGGFSPLCIVFRGKNITAESNKDFKEENEGDISYG